METKPKPILKSDRFIWTIVSPSGHPRPWHDSFYRKQTIESFEKGTGEPWVMMKEFGYTCRKIKLVEATDETK